VVSASGNVAILNNYDDGANNNYVLTTNLSVTNPADASSDNGNKALYRRVTVVYMSNDQTARQVYVRVFDSASNTPIAQVMSVLRTVPTTYVPSQTYDVYLLALDNVPGWWVLTSKLRPILDSVIQNLQTLNSGLVLRTHYITQLAYGRDPYYVPWINTSVSGTADSFTVPYVYFYPGWTITSLDASVTQVDQWYYNPSLMYGQLKVDAGASTTTGANTNVGSYTYSDQFNAGLRYPDELAAYNAAVASATAAGQTAPEISLRILLEELNENPSPLQNAIIMNLHGEMLPVPAMRNYSDAAKSPATYPGQRAVTHPQYLSYPSTRSVKLRVYAYMTPEYVDSTSSNVVVSTISVYLPGAYVPSTSISVRELFSGATYYTWGNARIPNNAICANVSGLYVPQSGDDYCVQGSMASGTTEIVLHNTLVRQSSTTVGSGLNTSMRLYGMEYVPSPPQAITSLTSGSNDFAEGVNDLADTASGDAKNTARWVIQIATGALANGQYQVQTRIGSDLTAGPTSSSATLLSNQSNTYIWVGSTPPVTETYQIMGDPRHLPYVDSKFYNNYNWEFVDLSTADEGATYETSSANGGAGTTGWGSVNRDMSRIYQLYRGGLINSGALWTQMAGYSFWCMSNGGNFGDTGNQLGYNNSGVPISQILWSQTGAVSSIYVNEIYTGNSAGQNARVIASTSNAWVADPWLGELYPDSVFATSTGWVKTGNLPTKSYYRANLCSTFGKTNNTFTYGICGADEAEAGGPAGFLNAYPQGSSPAGNTWFTQNGGDGDTANLTSTGTLVSSTFNYSLVPSLSAPRVLEPNGTTGQPQTWNNPVYKSQWTQSSVMLTDYVDATGGDSGLPASGLIKLSSGSSAAYFALNGTATGASFGTNDVAQLGLATALYGFMEAGAPYNSVGSIHQLPYIAITTPTVTQQFLNANSVTIGWSTSWNRWNDQLYTQTYPNGFSDNGVTLLYNVKYSPDNGSTWKFVQDGTAAQFGVLDASAAHLATSPTVWSVGGLPQATYLIVVEAYRSGYPLHYSYQELSVFLQL
jgi:hypothetical protein